MHFFDVIIGLMAIIITAVVLTNTFPDLLGRSILTLCMTVVYFAIRYNDTKDDRTFKRAVLSNDLDTIKKFHLASSVDLQFALKTAWLCH